MASWGRVAQEAGFFVAPTTGARYEVVIAVRAPEHSVMHPPLKRFALSLLAALLTVCPSVAQWPNPNVRFGLPSPAKADPRQREVYKVGDEAERQVYLVGKAPDGRWAGLKTTVVET